jgi:hypothetical protein
MRVPCALSLQKGELSVAITLLLTPGMTCLSVHMKWSLYIGRAELARHNTVESVLQQHEGMSSVPEYVANQ